MEQPFFVHPDIKKAETLPASFYRSQSVFEVVKEKVFTQCWQFVGDMKLLPFEKYAHPFWYLEHFVNEPLVLGYFHSSPNINVSPEPSVFKITSLFF